MNGKLPKLNVRQANKGIFYSPPGKTKAKMPYYHCGNICSICGCRLDPKTALVKDDSLHIQVEKQEGRVSLKDCKFCDVCVVRYHLKRKL